MSTNVATKIRIPKYARFADQVRRQIETGELKAGDQLPSFARMLSCYGMGQSTVERMYVLLEQEGLVIREPNRGIFVSVPRRPGKTGTIGLFTNPEGFSAHPYYMRLVSAVSRAAHEAHTEVVLMHENSRFTTDKIDGLLTCQGDIDRTIQRLPAALPVVSLVHPSSLVASVVADESTGIGEAIQHLVKLGHRRIAYLSCAAQSWTNLLAKQRIAAYQANLKAAGIQPLSLWVRPVFMPFEKKAVSFEAAGYERTKRWLEEDWRELGCTALLTHNDDVAVGAIDALLASGLRVPDDVSVVGFDGTEISDAHRPRLTTVEMPLSEIGARGVDLLLGGIADVSRIDPSAPPEKVILPTRFRARESTAAPAAA